MKIGLVLGAGGAVGGAYLAGALTALENDLGWDARSADVIVGTSAGSLVGAVLRRGGAASDLAAWTVDAPLTPVFEALAGSIERPEFEPVTLRQFLRLPRLPHPHAVGAVVRHPLRFDPLRALVTHLRDGELALRPHLEFLDGEWPSEELYVCAVRRRDGRRVVFGRDLTPRDGLGAAVAASCTVPGYFEPACVDGSLYIDGGVKSPTNADVLRGRGLDLVIALSPMSAAGRVSPRRIDALMRVHAGRQLNHELKILRAEGTRTLTLAPTRAVLDHVTTDFMSDESRNEIVQHAFLETGAQLRSAHKHGLLDGLGTRQHVA
jgi:NTE family protein